MGCLLHYSPKIYNKVFLFVGLTTLETLVSLIGWFIELSVKILKTLL